MCFNFHSDIFNAAVILLCVSKMYYSISFSKIRTDTFRFRGEIEVPYFTIEENHIPGGVLFNNQIDKLTVALHHVYASTNESLSSGNHFRTPC